MADTAGATTEAAETASADPRYQALDATMKRRQYRHDALIEVLHDAQGIFGYLTTDVLTFVGRQLQLPPSHVYGVATFYHFFSLEPPAEHTCEVCLGTACYAKGASALLAEVEREAGIAAGDTTADGKLTLKVSRCPGACGMAPLVVYDEVAAGHETAESTLRRVKGWLG
ncbi:NAD(P)H-dependent oxidoreductase subunit E [Candidatus Poribacteria bacterium]|nr:NAD(P)H-dependent oxidoreductase subunit E [Candidatus Poribacteria bacterium]